MYSIDLCQQTLPRGTELEETLDQQNAFDVTSSPGATSHLEYPLGWWLLITLWCFLVLTDSFKYNPTCL